MSKDFNKFMSQLQETNQTLDFFCDFDKIAANVDNIKLSLCMLNSMIGTTDLRKSVETIWNRDRSAFGVMDILIAVRSEGKKVVLNSAGDCIILDRLFTSIDGVMEFLEGTGLADLFRQKKINIRSRDLLILEDEFRECCDELYVMTDDGSYGEEGNVCVPLKRMLSSGRRFDKVITIGPLIMMKFVVEATRDSGIPCDVSMNPIMIDGTGMCGGCRLTLNVDGKRITKFACVDGPDFNGYEVDFDEAISRSNMYSDFERHAYESTCNLFRKEENDG